MNTSESIGKLAEALAKVQAEMPPIPKNGKNPFLKNEYVLLDDIVSAANKLLPVHGLAVLQMPVTIQGEIGVTTRLAHSSGEWIESTVTLPMSDEKGKSSAQVAGSVITYLRRYSLGALLGIASESDDDGNGKAQPKQTTQPEPAPANGKPQAEVVNLEQPGGHMTVTHKTPAAWKPDAIKWMVKEGHAKNSPHANEIWKLLELDTCASKAEVVKRVELYRKNKDEANQTTEVAAQHAIAGNDLTA